MFAPDKISVPLPTLIKEPPTPPLNPPSLMVPLTVVLRSLMPTMSALAPRLYVPAPSIEPAVIWSLPAGPVVPEKSNTPPALAMRRAEPAVLRSEKIV